MEAAHKDTFKKIREDKVEVSSEEGNLLPENHDTVEVSAEMVGNMS